MHGHHPREGRLPAHTPKGIPLAELQPSSAAQGRQHAASRVLVLASPKSRECGQSMRQAVVRELERSLHRRRGDGGELTFLSLA